MKITRAWLNLLLIAIFFALSPAARAEPCDDSATATPVVADLDTVIKTKPTPTEDTKNMEVLEGAPKFADAPATVTLPKVFNDGSEAAWGDSLPGGEALEQGGILVRGSGGEYIWHRGAQGKSGSWQPNYGDLGKGETLVAVLHTHPYGKSEGNLRDVAFSGGDLAAMVFAPENLDMVQSGSGMHMITKSQEFIDRVNKMTTQQKIDYANKIDAAFEAALSANMAAGQDFKTAVNKAALSTAHKYGMIYYRGTTFKPLSLVK